MRRNDPSPHILVVNHVPEALAHMQAMLENASLRVTTMAREEQSLTSIIEVQPDLVILDDMWPETEADWTLLTVLTSHHDTRDIPVMVYTVPVRPVRTMEGRHIMGLTRRK